jgi:hypothetical protein
MALYDDLLAGQYNGYVLLAQASAQSNIFDWNQQYSQNIQPWRVLPGSFDTVDGPQPNNWKKTSGYFVSTPTGPQCWTILGSGPYSISLRDMLANGLPEDIDIFSFKAVNPKAGTVNVSWVFRGTYLADAAPGWGFGGGTPEVFRVGFPGYTQGINSGLPSSVIWAGQ